MPLRTLAGIRVLDFSSYVAGPYSATLLADMGADVVKVEVPGGDMLRHYPSTLENGESRYHLGINRNKRGIVLDLKHPEAVRTCHELLKTADVVIHNFRPGVAEKLSLGFDLVKKLQPRIVYCSLSGYGLTGPIAGRPGFDQVLQCMTGVASAQGADTGVPTILWGSIIDYYAASMTAMAISAALFDRERTGEAQFVETSLLRSALALQAGRMVWAEGEGRDVERDLRPGRISGIHPAKDSYIYLQAQSPPFWKALCELTGLGHLAGDSRYDDMKKRKQHEDELVAQLRAALATRTATEWETLFGERVPCAVVRDLEDMFDHPQVAAQGLVVTHAHPNVGSYKAMIGPVSIDGAENKGRSAEQRAPLLGEHTEGILRRAGLSPERIEALRKDGAIN
jgi:crotonobetainyl-CoA:carnitine CoA-transferase CaiB-like acyl-CoA transferase